MSKIKTVSDINNLPTYAEEYKYIVASLYECRLWFYGAYNDRARANEVANTIGNGCVFEVDNGEE